MRIVASKVYRMSGLQTIIYKINCTHGRKWKIFILLMNLRLAIHVGQNLLSSQFLRPFLLNSLSWELLLCHSPVSVKQRCRWCLHHPHHPILILITLNSGCPWRSPLLQDFHLFLFWTDFLYQLLLVTGFHLFLEILTFTL